MYRWEGQQLQLEMAPSASYGDGVAVVPVGLGGIAAIQLTAQMRNLVAVASIWLSRRHRWVGADLWPVPTY